MFYKINNWLNSNKAITGLLLFLLAFTFLFWLGSAPTLSDPDSFYHAKMAELIGQKGVIKDFPYLPFTTLKDGYIDHHLLYHFYLAPFVIIFPPLVGAKIGHLLLAALMIWFFYHLLNQLKISGAIWYTIFLLFIEPFIFRISLVKAQPLSLLILFLGFYLIIRRRYWWLMALSFIYVWSYGGWFLIFVLAVIYVLVNSLEDAFLQSKQNWLLKIINFKQRRTDWSNKLYFFSFSLLKNIFSQQNLKLIFSVSGGLVLGLVINPYFPTNLEFYWIQVVKIALVNYQGVIGVGAEWYPYKTLDFFLNNLLPFSLSFVALAIFLNYHQKFDTTVKYALALFLIFVLVTIKARRNIEYLGPFALIFSALTFSRSLMIKEFRDDWQTFKKIINKNFFSNWYVKIWLAMLSAVLLAAVFYQMPYQAKKSLDRGLSYNYLKSASKYLTDNSEVGDIIFHSDWDEFPLLFYHNSKNYYIAGLDPTFMYLNNSELYQKWADITRGQRYKNMYDIIKNDFQAKYVLATLDHQEFIKNLDNNFYFAKVYSDNEAVIYKVL